MTIRGTLVLAALAVLTLGAPVQAKNGSGHSGALQATGTDPDARGRAVVRVRGASDGRFELKVSKLDPRATYEVFVNGVRVGAIQTTGGGSGKIRFRSRPRADRDEILGFDPRGALVAVRNSAGQDVLAATLPTSTANSGDVICCVPDDSGPECEDRTVAECAAQGGTVSTATSCLPNPCDGVAPPVGGDVVCCIPDDSGPECEDRTPSQCAAQGGIVISATSCMDNPCAGTPSADPDIRCCLPDDSGTECEDRTPAECAAQGGVDLGPGLCAVDTCAGVTPPSGSTATVRVRCELRSDRSKISVDGSGLAAGSYSARAISGANQAVSNSLPAVAGQAEFDFDSDGGDIAAGASPIAVDFLQGNPPQARGQILDAQGSILAESLVTCDLR